MSLVQKKLLSRPPQLRCLAWSRLNSGAALLCARLSPGLSMAQPQSFTGGTLKGPIACFSSHRILNRRPFDPYSYEIYRKNPGIMSRLLAFVPGPVKSFAAMAGTAAVLFFVATPLLIIATPPLVLGMWWYSRRVRKIAKELYDQRWTQMAENHLKFRPSASDDIFRDVANTMFQGGEKIPTRARHRVLAALMGDEQGIATDLGYAGSTKDYQFRFTDVESIEQDFRASSMGFQEDLEMSSYGLLEVTESGYEQRLADVVVFLQRDAGRQEAKLRIEVRTKDGRTYVFDGGDEASDPNDVIIDVSDTARENPR